MQLGSSVIYKMRIFPTSTKCKQPTDLLQVRLHSLLLENDVKLVCALGAKSASVPLRLPIVPPFILPASTNRPDATNILRVRTEANVDETVIRRRLGARPQAQEVTSVYSTEERET